jgi:acetolactate synthase-1/2/3 large subunit
MKASDLFVRCLELEGVETIYGVPGEENADVMMSLLESPIEFIVCRHEQGAAFMADVHGRLTGKPGVCLGTLGPGATNLLTGVANANFDRSPVVALTGQTSTLLLHKESHQNMDVVSMFRPVSKWSTTVRSADNIPEIIHKAFKLAAAEKPGATHIEFPEDIAKHTTAVAPFRDTPVLRRPMPNPKAVDQAMKFLAESTAPIILAGNGCIRKRASRQLHEFVDNTGIHATNTFMGKGALAADNTRCLYTAGLGTRDYVTEAFEKADLVLCIGYDMIEWPPDQWNIGCDKRIIHIDFEPSEADEHYQADVEIIGDLAASLAAINERLGPPHRKSTPLFDHLREHVTKDLHEHDTDDRFPMVPQRILSDLRQVLAPEDIVISDVGAHKMWIARHYPVLRPGTCIISNGFCSMGIALPGAIAAKRTLPGRNAVGLMGDGGFLMNVQELATAVQYNIPAAIVVWEGGGYGLIRWKQQALFGRTSHTEFQNPDFAKLAETFGCQGIRVESANEFKAALEKALGEKTRPSVVVVPVDYSENLLLPDRLGKPTCH